MRRARLAAAIGALLLPFACKCPASDPQQVEPHLKPVQLERPRVLDPQKARKLKFQDKFKLTKQKPFLPPGVGPNRHKDAPGSQPAASQPASQPAAAQPEAAPAPVKPPPTTKANPTP